MRPHHALLRPLCAPAHAGEAISAHRDYEIMTSSVTRSVRPRGLMTEDLSRRPTWSRTSGRAVAPRCPAGARGRGGRSV
ncbi:hypothetical protein SCOCK_250008 [Actinacidiphila cocklensis]|uniref:Uncharacterized protein n=1 Tax=Actinacidiphila cocklensis TaxID=887465 RepID=A0A9W4GR11_9ACTN|nr:hypothetical protein SCOCK_250008 [Actinacidiphila cocklensis]